MRTPREQSVSARRLLVTTVTSDSFACRVTVACVHAVCLSQLLHETEPRRGKTHGLSPRALGFDNGSTALHERRHPARTGAGHDGPHSASRRVLHVKGVCKKWPADIAQLAEYPLRLESISSLRGLSAHLRAANPAVLGPGSMPFGERSQPPSRQVRQQNFIEFSRAGALGNLAVFFSQSDPNGVGPKLSE